MSRVALPGTRQCNCCHRWLLMPAFGLHRWKSVATRERVCLECKPLRTYDDSRLLGRPSYSCTSCERELPAAAFNLTNSGRRVRSICRECSNLQRLQKSGVAPELPTGELWSVIRAACYDYAFATAGLGLDAGAATRWLLAGYARYPTAVTSESIASWIAAGRIPSWPDPDCDPPAAATAAA